MKPLTSFLSLSLIVVLLLSLSGCSTPNESQTQATTLVETTASMPTTKASATITSAGTYTFSGKTDPIVVSATKEDHVEIILDSVDITSSTQAPIYIEEAKDVTILLAKNSVNTVIDNRTTEAETEDFPNAAIYSMSDLKIKGEVSSSLTVTGNLNDGITSKDDLKIKEVNITVTAKDDGIIGKDSLEAEESIITVTSGGDAFKITNYETEGKGLATFEDSDVTISAGDDAVHAVSAIHFKSGTMNILESYEGLESELIVIDGGTIVITAEDDGVNIAEMGYQTEEEKAAKAARSAQKLARAAQETGRTSGANTNGNAPSSWRTA